MAGFPAIVPASVLQGGAKAPNNRIHVAMIGIGRVGRGHLRYFLGQDDIRVIGLCDVQQTVREKQKSIVDAAYGDNSCSTYNDFRELLARPDLDAVLIAAPEHWHPLIGIEAARRGKHMYYEKPLSLTVEQGKAVREAVRRYGVVFQFGTQQRSSPFYRFTCELVRNGRIGQLKTVVVGSSGGPGKRLDPERIDPVPPGFDWDMWLGPAPWTPYSDLRVSALWMHIYDYGLGGMDGAYGIHDIDIAQWVNDADDTGPISVEGTGRLHSDIRDTVAEYDLEYKYANGVQLHYLDLPAARKRYPQFEKGPGLAVVCIGTEGWIYVSRQGVVTYPESLMRTTIGPNEIHVRKSDDHHRNFLDAIRTGKETVSPVEVAVRDETICQMGDLAVRLGRKLNWDPVKEEFVGDEQANRRLSRLMRSPWRLDPPEMTGETRRSS